MSSHPLIRLSQEVSSKSFGIAQQLAAAAVLGVVVLYGVAFAESQMLHNAAHDVRHITVKPCH